MSVTNLTAKETNYAKRQNLKNEAYLPLSVKVERFKRIVESEKQKQASKNGFNSRSTVISAFSRSIYKFKNYSIRRSSLARRPPTTKLDKILGFK